MYYDEISKSYEELYGLEQTRKIQHVLKLLDEKPKKVLDVGCGTGIASDYFENYTGFDPSKELTKIAKEKKRKGWIFIDSAENFSTKEKYDLIICLTVAHHFQDKIKAINNMKIHLKENGLLILSLLKKSPSNKEVLEILKKHFEIETSQNEKDIFYKCKPKKFI